MEGEQTYITVQAIHLADLMEITKDLVRFAVQSDDEDTFLVSLGTHRVLTGLSRTHCVTRVT